MAREVSGGGVAVADHRDMSKSQRVYPFRGDSLPRLLTGDKKPPGLQDGGVVVDRAPHAFCSGQIVVPLGVFTVVVCPVPVRVAAVEPR